MVEQPGPTPPAGYLVEDVWRLYLAAMAALDAARAELAASRRIALRCLRIAQAERARAEAAEGNYLISRAESDRQNARAEAAEARIAAALAAHNNPEAVFYWERSAAVIRALTKDVE